MNRERVFRILALFGGIFILYEAGYVFLGGVLPFPNDTLHSYAPAAENLAEGRGYTLHGRFLVRYPPLFPLFIAALFRLSGPMSIDNGVFQHAVILLQTASCFLIFCIARIITTVRTAILSAVLLATCPFFVVLSITRYAWTYSPLLIFLFLLHLFFVVRGNVRCDWKLIAAAGLIAGLAALTWPGAICVGIVSLTFLFFGNGSIRRKHRMVFIIVFLVGIMIPLFIWETAIIRNTGRFFVISSNNISSVLDGLVHHQESKLREFEVSRQIAEELKQNRTESIHDILTLLLDQFRVHPGKTIRFLGFKLLRPWYATDSEKHETMNAIIQVPYLILALAGVVALRKKETIYTVYFAGMIIGFWLVSATVLSILRYMLPAMAIMMIFTAAGVDQILERRAAGGRGKGKAARSRVKSHDP